MTRIQTAGAITLALLALGACGREHKATFSFDDGKGGGHGATATTTTTTTNGATTTLASSDEGRVKIDAPGFKLDVAVPKSMVDSTDFKMDGVKMYPGTRMHGIQVQATGGDHDDAHVNIAFESPAAPDVVRGYMMGRFAERGRPVTANGMTLSGRTKEGKPFTIALSPQGDHTHGEISIIGSGGGNWSSE